MAPSCAGYRALASLFVQSEFQKHLEVNFEVAHARDQTKLYLNISIGLHPSTPLSTTISHHPATPNYYHTTQPPQTTITLIKTTQLPQTTITPPTYPKLLSHHQATPNYYHTTKLPQTTITPPSYPKLLTHHPATPNY